MLTCIINIYPGTVYTVHCTVNQPCVWRASRGSQRSGELIEGSVPGGSFYIKHSILNSKFCCLSCIIAMITTPEFTNCVILVGED